MILHSLAQNEQAWHEHRAKYFNASDAPAMLGISPYKKRSELLKEIATGISPEVDDFTQRIFDKGHHLEALARPLAEEFIDEDLYPVTGTLNKLSASFDGLTMDQSIAFEHKTLNNTLLTVTCADELPDHYKAQMEQQLYVSGATKCLFMATNRDHENNLTGLIKFYYTPDQALRRRLLDGWARFEKDLETWQYTAPPASAKAEPMLSLPALIVQIKGEITASNLPDFKDAADNFINKINVNLKTDDDFAEAEATVKFCDKAEKELEQVKRNALSQTSDIDECMRTIDYIREQLRIKRLMLDKLVKSQKEALKIAIITQARNDYSDFCDSHREFLHLLPSNNFAGVIKNKRTLTSVQDAVDNELARLKIEADNLIKEISLKINWFNESCQDYHFLFSDIKDLVTTSEAVFKYTVEKRITDYEQQKAAKLEAERAALRAEEQAKIVEQQRLDKLELTKAEALRKQAASIEKAAHYADRNADKAAELAGAQNLRKQADDIELSFTDDSIEIEPTIIKPVKSGSITQAMIVFAIAEKYGLSDDQALEVILNAFNI